MDRSADKKMSEKSLPMIKGGGDSTDSSSEETGSSRSYPKGGGVNTNLNFNPMKDRRRGGTDWAVGGI